MSMTEKLIRNENEAIDVLKKNKPTSGYYMLQESVDMAIQALEEIQQIKEIISSFPLDCGSTVEDIREIYKQLRGFLQFGSIEEFKALKEKNEPKKPIDKISHIECPRCGTIKAIHNTYCSACGQKLDWQ